MLMNNMSEMNYTKPKISIDPQGQKIKYDAEFYVDDGVPELNSMGMQDVPPCRFLW
jgi:hypothetical protein